MANFTGPRANQIRTSNQQPDLAQWMQSVDKRTGHFGGRVATRLGLSSLIPFEDLQVFIDDEKKYVVFKNGVWEDILGGGGTGGNTGGGGTGTIDPAIEGRVAELEKAASTMSKSFTEDFKNKVLIDTASTTASIVPGQVYASKIPTFKDTLDSDANIDLLASTNVVVSGGVAKLAPTVKEAAFVTKPIPVNNATRAKVEATVRHHSEMGFGTGKETVTSMTTGLYIANATTQDLSGRMWQFSLNDTGVLRYRCTNIDGTVAFTKTHTMSLPYTFSTNMLDISAACDKLGRIWVTFPILTGARADWVLSVLATDGSVIRNTTMLGASGGRATSSKVFVDKNNRVWFAANATLTSSGSGFVKFMCLNEDLTYFVPETVLYNSTSRNLSGLDIVYDSTREKIIIIYQAITSSIMLKEFNVNTGIEGDTFSLNKKPTHIRAFFLPERNVIRIFHDDAVTTSASGLMCTEFDIPTAKFSTPVLVGGLSFQPSPSPFSIMREGNLYHVSYASYIATTDTKSRLRYNVFDGNSLTALYPDIDINEAGENAAASEIYKNAVTGDIEIFALMYGTIAVPSTTGTYLFKYKMNETKLECQVSSDNGLNWMPATLGQYVSFTVPTNSIRIRFKLIAPSTITKITPEVLEYSLSDIANDTAEKIAQLVSSKLPSLDTVSKITLTADQLLNGGSIEWFASNDGGTNWHSIGLGQRFSFPAILNGDLRVKAVITSPLGATTSPVIKGYTVITGNTVVGIDLQEIEANIAKTNFRFTALLNISKYSLKNMFIDTFADSSGIDSVKTNGVQASQGSLLLANAGVSLVPKLSTATSSLPIVVSESSYSSLGATSGWRLFDYGYTHWQSRTGTDVAPDAPEWVQVDFGVGNDKKVDVYTLSPYNTTSRLYDPKDFKLQGSHNGYEWTTVDMRTGQTWLDLSDKKTFTVGTPGFYRYYRLLIEETTGTAQVVVAEMELFSMGTGTGIGTVYSAPEEVNTVPSKVFLVVDETLNTGTITYEVSRDNGVSWKSMEKERLLDVSDQPNGTKLVLRATITGNALLHSWALSWK